MALTTRGWLVTLAGSGINLALGVVSSLILIAEALARPDAASGLHPMTLQQASWPVTVAIGVFALTMVYAGRLQDAFGPRWVATLGGLLTGIGLLVASQVPPTVTGSSAFPPAIVTLFGVVTGTGVGFAYAATTPAAAKWFATQHKGLASGIVVGGFAVAWIFAAPLVTILVDEYGVSGTLAIFGVGVAVVIVGLAQLLADPPSGYVPPHAYSEPTSPEAPHVPVREFGWREMIRTPCFVVLWLTFAFAAFAGLMIISVVAQVAVVQLPSAATTVTPLLLAVLAAGNAIGRPASGLLSDRIGRQRTMLAIFLGQAAMVALLGLAHSLSVLTVAVFFIGLNHGGNLVLFPATTYDFFGARNSGVNYGFVFTAWGVGGVFGSQIAALAFDHSHTLANPLGSYWMAYAIAVVLCLAAALLTIVERPPDQVLVARRQASDVAVRV